MTIREFMTLFPVACASLFSSLWTKGLEVLLYGRHLWWWKVQAQMACSYALDPPHRIIRRFEKSSAHPRDNLIYGETPLFTFDLLIRKLPLAGKETFIDLGCGRGLPCFFARCLLGIPSLGVDCVPEFIERASRIRDSLGLGELDFLRGNFIDVDLHDGAIVYIAGTTFDGATMDLLAEKLKKAPGKIVVISLSQAFPSPPFRTIHQGSYLFSWGRSQVFIQEKDPL